MQKQETNASPELNGIPGNTRNKLAFVEAAEELLRGPPLGSFTSGRNKAWVVTVGRKTGVFQTWAATNAQTTEFSGDVQQGYRSLAAAQAAWDQVRTNGLVRCLPRSLQQMPISEQPPPIYHSSGGVHRAQRQTSPDRYNPHRPGHIQGPTVVFSPQPSLEKQHSNYREAREAHHQKSPQSTHTKRSTMIITPQTPHHEKTHSSHQRRDPHTPKTFTKSSNQTATPFLPTHSTSRNQSGSHRGPTSASCFTDGPEPLSGGASPPPPSPSPSPPLTTPYRRYGGVTPVIPAALPSASTRKTRQSPGLTRSKTSSEFAMISPRAQIHSPNLSDEDVYWVVIRGAFPGVYHGLLAANVALGNRGAPRVVKAGSLEVASVAFAEAFKNGKVVQYV